MIELLTVGADGADDAARLDGICDVAIVGAGIAGLSLADALVRRGRSVRVVDAGTIGGQGASALPLALLNPHRGRSGRAHPDDLEGLRAFWRRDARLRAAGAGSGAERSGVLRVATSSTQSERWRELAASVDTADWRHPADVPSGVHAPHGALFVPDGGWVDPAKLLAALARAAVAGGASIAERTRVVAARGGVAGTGADRQIDPSADRATVRGADSTAGRSADRTVAPTAARTLSARAAVLCVGAALEPGLPVPELTRLEGDVVTLSPAPSLAHPVAGGVYGGTRSDAAAGSGTRAFVGGNHRAPSPPADDPGPEDLRRVAERLRDRFARAVPGFAGAEVVAHWRGVRAKRPGHRPWALELEPDLWFFGAFAGRGFLCAAADAERLAGRLDDGLAATPGDPRPD